MGTAWLGKGMDTPPPIWTGLVRGLGTALAARSSKTQFGEGQVFLTRFLSKVLMSAHLAPKSKKYRKSLTYILCVVILMAASGRDGRCLGLLWIAWVAFGPPPDAPGSQKFKTPIWGRSHFLYTFPLQSVCFGPLGTKIDKNTENR